MEKQRNDVKIDGIIKAEDAMTIAGILVQNGHIVEVARYKPTKANAYRYYVRSQQRNNLDKETENRISELKNREDRLKAFIGQYEERNKELAKKDAEEKDYSIGIGTGIMSYIVVLYAIHLLLIDTKVSLIFSGVLFTVSAILIGTTVGCLIGYTRTRRRVQTASRKR